MGERWTPRDDGILADLAPSGCGSSAIARKLKRTVKAIRGRASEKGIPIRYPISLGMTRLGHSPSPPWWDEDLRLRWAALIGPMKESLRADLAKSLADDAP